VVWLDPERPELDFSQHGVLAALWLVG
jgi:hypothetical protein